MNIITSVVIFLAAFAARMPARSGAIAALPHSFAFHHDGILGTSVDLTFVTASGDDAQRAEDVALAGIERLRRILSSWDSTSEVSRLFATGALDRPAPELVTVLNQYAAWNARSGHAYSARTGELATLWQRAAISNVVPDSAVLARTVAAITAPAWRIDPASNRITALTSQRVDLNSLGKGFIIDRVIALVRDSVPTLRGALIDIGGDIHVWGVAPSASAWRIAVADPASHADNATPLTQLALVDGAVSSSGDYQRGFTVAGRHYSHIIDPRSGYPADQVTGVTVIAPDNATANALATTLSVLPPERGLTLAQSTPGVEALLVTAEGNVLRTPGFARYEVAAPARMIRPAAAFTASLTIDVTPSVRVHHPPYVVVWITDTAGTPVRTLSFWGDEAKYQREMTHWFTANHGGPDFIDAVTRATRPAGKYALDWDGLDQHGAALPAGPYLFWLEVAFEDGPHSVQSVAVTCGGAHASGAISSAAAFTGAEISCDPVKQ